MNTILFLFLVFGSTGSYELSYEEIQSNNVVFLVKQIKYTYREGRRNSKRTYNYYLTNSLDEIKCVGKRFLSKKKNLVFIDSYWQGHKTEIETDCENSNETINLRVIDELGRTYYTWKKKNRCINGEGRNCELLQVIKLYNPDICETRILGSNYESGTQPFIINGNGGAEIHKSFLNTMIEISIINDYESYDQLNRMELEKAGLILYSRK